MLLTVISCHHNRLKTNEKELAKEIIMQEKEKEEAYKNEQGKRLADTVNRPSKGFRSKEDRSVDPAHPPVTIDFEGNLNNLKSIKLSDIASEISYVRMQPVPDSMFSRVMKFRYYLFSENIVAVNPSGILLYSKDGKYINTIVKNKTTGINVDAEWMFMTGVNTFIGAGTSIWPLGNSFIYNYRNSINGQEYMMEYDLSKTQVAPLKQYEPENPDQILGLGEIAIDVNPAKRKPVWKYKIAPELISWGMPRDYIYQSVGTFYLDKSTFAKEIERTDKIAVLNNNGDTLSSFNGFEEDNTIRFENDGKQFLWNNMNDTIFHISGFNRIIPAMVVKLGQYKASLEQEKEIGFDITGKIIPGSWAETEKSIFLTFSKDAYDSPNNRKNKKVKIYYAMYSKLSLQLWIIKGDPLDYSPEILENNIDGGVPVWPLSYMIGNNGEILISLKGKELKDRVTSDQFKHSGAPEGKKQELEKLAASVSNDEDILMIIK